MLSLRFSNYVGIAGRIRFACVSTHLRYPVLCIYPSTSRKRSYKRAETRDRVSKAGVYGVLLSGLLRKLSSLTLFHAIHAYENKGGLLFYCLILRAIQFIC